jgi:hypothetical protein
MLGECLSCPHNVASIWNEYWCLGCLTRCRPSVVISWQQNLLNLHKCCICLSHYERKTGVKSYTGKCSIAIIITSNTVEDGVHLRGDLPNARRSQLLRMCKLWNSIVAPKENRSELVWGISQCENFQGSWTIFLLLVCIWGGLYLKQKDGNEQSGTPGPVIHYSLVFVYSIGIGTWFLFLTDVQLCKIDAEGKAQKVVGYSCVVVKVNWGYMAWF